MTELGPAPRAERRRAGGKHPAVRTAVADDPGHALPTIGLPPGTVGEFRVVPGSQVESGRTVKDVCREHGIAEGTYYRWKAKCGGLDVSEARRLKELERENRRLKSAVADLTLREQALKEALQRKW